LLRDGSSFQSPMKGLFAADDAPVAKAVEIANKAIARNVRGVNFMSESPSAGVWTRGTSFVRRVRKSGLDESTHNSIRPPSKRRGLGCTLTPIHGCLLFIYTPGQRAFGTADCKRKAFSWICPRPRLVRAVERSKCATKRSSAPVALHVNLNKNG
jgi:hypothetical protein